MLIKLVGMLGLIGTTMACETAWARLEGNNQCFLDEPMKPNRWGWTNLIDEGVTNVEFPIYAAAGQCVLEKGELVGALVVNYNDGEVTIKYEYISGFYYTEYHLYVGKEPYNKNNKGKKTVAPGSFPYNKNNKGKKTVAPGSFPYN
eukprot:Hpha_TRINITY_DN14941_c2_g7::TRINITY_DN14941_c2_g7_i6::g.143586::m.143586